MQFKDKSRAPLGVLDTLLHGFFSISFSFLYFLFLTFSSSRAFPSLFFLFSGAIQGQEPRPSRRAGHAAAGHIQAHYDIEHRDGKDTGER